VLHFQCIWNHLGLLLGLVFINLCFLSICLNNWNYKQVTYIWRRRYTSKRKSSKVTYIWRRRYTSKLKSSKVT
jgi:hypothetical protein